MNGKIFLKETIAIKSIIFLFLYITFSGASCMSVSERMYNVPRLNKKIKTSDIIISYSKPEKNHIIIGEISVRYNAAYKREIALNELLRKSASYGADGIIINTIHRSEEKWSMTHRQDDTPVQFGINIYVLSGFMYQFRE